MKIISWNVNGIRSAIKKGLRNFIKQENADIYFFQEIKLSLADDKDVAAALNLPDYRMAVSLGKKAGYSGLIIYAKNRLFSDSKQTVASRIGHKDIDDEARFLIMETENEYLINAYFPHSGRELARLDFKKYFNDKFIILVKKLVKKKPIIIGGDFNVAHTEIDLANPSSNQHNAGFTPVERLYMDRILNIGLIDSFRMFNKGPGNYTWWSNRLGARERNIGWRIDYFLVDNTLKPKIKESKILKTITGSDHCPISLEIGL